MDHKNELLHFNPNHDPKSGQFTSGNGGSGILRKPKKASRSFRLISEDEAYYKDDGSLTFKGKRRVKKTMSKYNDMVTASNASEKKKAEKQFTKMSNKLTDPEMSELIKKVTADKTIREMYQKEQTQQNQKAQGGTNKYQMSPTDFANITKTVIESMGKLGSMASEKTTRQLDTEIKRQSLLQSKEQTKQAELNTIKAQSDLVKSNSAFNRPPDRYNVNNGKNIITSMPLNTYTISSKDGWYYLNSTNSKKTK